MKPIIGRNRHRSGYTLLGVIVGVALVVVGIVIAVYIKRWSNLKPKQLPPEEETQNVQPFNPVTDISQAESDTLLTPSWYQYSWPPQDFYFQGDMPDIDSIAMTNKAFEMIEIAPIEVMICLGGINGSGGNAFAPVTDTNNWVSIGKFDDGDTNKILTNQYVTMQLNADMSGVDIKQTEWARTNIPMMFFRSVRAQ